MRHASRIASLLCLLWLCASANLAFAQTSDIAITKSGPSTASAGSNISVTYNLSLTNFGPDASATVTLTDPIPPGMVFSSITSDPAFTCTDPGVGNNGTITCSVASMLNGATANFSITLLIPSATAGNTFTNIASVSCPTDSNSENDSATAVTIVPTPQADAYIIKTGPSAVSPNTDISYTITVGNNGPDPATNVSWTDTLPGGAPAGFALTFVSFTQNTGPAFSCGAPAATTTCTIASLAAGASATFTFVGHVPNGTPSGTTYTNTATITSDSDPSSENNTASTAAVVTTADVGVVKTAPATAVAGASFSYVITLSNAGPDAALNARFTDALPAGITFVSITQNTGPAASCATPAVGTNGSVSCSVAILNNGASAQFTVTVQTASGTANGTVISNTATAATDSVDSNAGNNTSSANTTISTSADLSVVKTGPAGVVAGGNATYTLTVANAGPSDAAAVSLTDPLPAGSTFVSLVQNSGPLFACAAPAVGACGTVTCTRASLVAGGSAAFTLVAKVAPGAANGSTVTNTATVASTTSDPTPGNNTSPSTATVSASADLAITKTASYSGVLNGNIVYTIAVTNNGPSAASAVQLSDPLPAGTHFVSLTQSGPAFACTPPAVGAGGTVNCNIATLANGATTTFTLTVDTVGLIGGTVANTASASSSTGDANPANNTAAANVALASSPPVPAPMLRWPALLLLIALLAAIAMTQRRVNRSERR